MQPARELKFVAAGIRFIAITAADANDAGFIVGRLYKLSYSTTSAASTVPGAVIGRWGSAAAVAGDGGGDFCLNAGESMYLRATNATMHAIGVGGTGAVGSLVASLVDEGA